MQGPLLDVPAQVVLREVQALAEVAKYRGVKYHKRDRVFEAWLYVSGGPGAYDAALRRWCPNDNFRLNKFRNFPTKAEASYRETPAQARRRALTTNGDDHRKDVTAFELLQHEFCLVHILRPF